MIDLFCMCKQIYAGNYVGNLILCVGNQFSQGCYRTGDLARA